MIIACNKTYRNTLQNWKKAAVYLVILLMITQFLLLILAMPIFLKSSDLLANQSSPFISPAILQLSMSYQHSRYLFAIKQSDPTCTCVVSSKVGGCVLLQCNNIVLLSFPKLSQVPMMHYCFLLSSLCLQNTLSGQDAQDWSSLSRTLSKLLLYHN